jgi:hypothetical protein
MKNRTLTIVLVTSLALIAAQVAWSAIPAGNGTITGCYKISGGALRVVATKSACDSATERSLVWRQGPSHFDIDVPFSHTDRGSRVVVHSNGLTLTTTCYIEFVSGGTEGGGMHVDPGPGGIVNTGYTEETIGGGAPVPKQDGASGPLDIGKTAAVPTGTAVHRLEGALVARTATNVISITFHEVVDYTLERCQFMGTVSPA